MPVSSLLLSDVHLSRDTGRATSRALARLIADQPVEDLILVGDILDLSLFPAGSAAQDGARATLAPHGELISALHRHVCAGRRVVLVPGNHDAGIEGTQATEALRTVIRPPDDRQLVTQPWFVRRDAVHIEHGHLYDRDCAPSHPLAPFDPRTEGLGTALMRRFIAPNDALVFAHAHATTPVSGLRRAFEHFGDRAPLVILNYFRTALSLCAEAWTSRDSFQRERTEGALRLAEHAAASGVDQAALVELLARVPAPTHHGFGDTFLRLYFDRIFASLALAGGLSLLAVSGLALAAKAPLLPGAAALLTVLGGGYLAHQLVRPSPPKTSPVSSLGRAARLVQQTTGADLVIFGHTHVEVDEPGYVNLGSFGFGGPRRPYLLLGPSDRPERRHTAPASA